MTHGHAVNRQRSLTYRAWQNMKTRCLNPRYAKFADYGGRGITICNRWLNFANFAADMGERPSVNHSIDRYPDNNGNYEPGNCRWATPLEQARNQRKTILVTIDGEAKCVAEWCAIFGINRSTFQSRMNKLGWRDPVEALTTPAGRAPRIERIQKTRKRTLLTLGGRTLSVDEWAAITGIKADTIRWRKRGGWNDHDTLTKSVRPILRKDASGCERNASWRYA